VVLAFFASLLLFPLTVEATSIVVITTRHGIVIGADGKITLTNPGSERRPRSAGTRTKIVLVKNRIAVAQCGVESIGNGAVTPYSFDSLVEYLQSNTSPRVDVTELVVVIKRKLSQMFEGFDVMLKAGRLRRTDLPSPEDTLLQLYVAGYEHGQPLAYTVRLDIDWAALQLKEPVKSTIYPNPVRKNICITWTGGSEHGIIELASGVVTDGTRNAVKTMPIGLKALREGQDIPLGQTLALARGLLDLEVSSNPDTVGYPLTIFTIRQSGSKKHTYSDQRH
jgi:hypothetical protein